jgi:hypothetical protein
MRTGDSPPEGVPRAFTCLLGPHVHLQVGSKLHAVEMLALVCICVLLAHTVRAQLGFADAGALGAQAGGHAAAFTVTDPSSLSVLSRFASNGYVKLKPYPYLVVNHALPPELYRALEANFLTDTAILALNGETERKQNFRYDVPATKLLGQGAAQHVTSLWQQFARYHTSRAFYDEVDAILGPHIRKLHPLKPNFRTGVRCVPHAPHHGRLCAQGLERPSRRPHGLGDAHAWRSFMRLGRYVAVRTVAWSACSHGASVVAQIQRLGVGGADGLPGGDERARQDQECSARAALRRPRGDVGWTVVLPPLDRLHVARGRPAGVCAPTHFPASP